MPREQGRKLVAQNKKARHDYHIEDVFEAGMVLTGSEVKSLREGRASLVDGFAQVRGGEASCTASTSRSTRRRPGPTTSRAGSASCCCTAPRSTS